MKKIRVGINGFGRIGRNAARIILARKDVELAAINSRADVSSHQYLLKHDSAYGTLKDHTINTDGENLTIDGNTVQIFKEDLPQAIPWDKAGVDIVIESSGKFRTSEEAQGHLAQGAKFVVISSPVKDETKTYVLGVNHTQFNPTTDKIISNSSCTTNCLATTVKVLQDELGIVRGYMTTIHAVTDSQNLLDNSHKKETRLRRASFVNMIPTSTGSARDIAKLYPELKGKLVCKAIRVPLITGSIIDLTVQVQKETDKETVNELFKKYSQNSLKGILAVATEELVSGDFIGTPFSSTIDPYMTEVLGGNLVKVYAWYDNEWGYTSRLVDMVEYVGAKGLK